MTASRNCPSISVCLCVCVRTRMSVFNRDEKETKKSDTANELQFKRADFNSQGV